MTKCEDVLNAWWSRAMRRKSVSTECAAWKTQPHNLIYWKSLKISGRNFPQLLHIHLHTKVRNIKNVSQVYQNTINGCATTGIKKQSALPSWRPWCCHCPIPEVDMNRHKHRVLCQRQLNIWCLHSHAMRKRQMISWSNSQPTKMNNVVTIFW